MSNPSSTSATVEGRVLAIPLDAASSPGTSSEAQIPNWLPEQVLLIYLEQVDAVESGGGTATKAATLERVSRTMAWLVLALACVVLTGWVLNIRTLTSVVPGYNTMKVNTAFCLLGLGGALLVRRRSVAAGFLVGVGLLASTTLVEIWSGRTFGIDELMVQDLGTTGGAAPGRMATAAAVAVLSLALALGLVFANRARAAEAVLLLPLIVAITGLLGYLYDVEQLYRVASLSSVAIHTALAVLLLTVAIAALVPGGLLPWTTIGRGPGSAMVRQTAPVIIVGLGALGMAQKSFGDAGAFGVHFGIALMVMIGIVIAVGATAQAAIRLDAADEARAGAETSLRELNLSLKEGRDEAWARANRLSEELISERERFERAISSTDSVVWTVETTSGQPQPIYASPNAERVLGDQFLPGETGTAALARLVDEDQRESALEFRRRLREGVEAEAELRLCVAGRVKWVRIQGIPRREGSRVFHDGIITDHTELHALAEQRELLLVQEQLQVERLSELNRARDDFIAVAGHELRTPVAVILGYLELLEDPEGSQESKAQTISVISRRAQQLSELVERVFDLAKVESGAMDLNLESVPARSFVTDLIEEHQPAADAARVNLSMASVATSVVADRPRLQQVFDNLLSNALKFTPPGGHVELRVTEHGDDVVFDLSDDGIGVTADELPRLFDRLFRASSAREAGIPGTGLGLAVAKSLVEAQGGTMTVQANDSHGLLFTVTLPRAGARLAGSSSHDALIKRSSSSRTSTSMT